MLFRLAIAVAISVTVSIAWADTIEEKAQVCGACHGEKGVPTEGVIPIIWGQNAGYLYLQLRDFQKGARKDERMSPIAEALSKEDALALGEYFAAKPWPDLAQPAAGKGDVAVANRINTTIVCTSCHGDAYRGDSSVPRTADQQHDYLVKTMLDFRTRVRANNPGMSDLMNAASEDDLKAIANYLAGL
jgi:cytochrome c553